MLIQSKFPDKIWSKIEEITPKYSYSKITVDVQDEVIVITENGYLLVPSHDEQGALIKEDTVVETTTHKVLLRDIQKQYLDDNSHFALDYDGNIYPISINGTNKTNYLKSAMDICNRCMAYIYFPISECTFTDTLIVIPTSINTEVIANCDFISDIYKNINLTKLKDSLYPNIKITHPKEVKAGDICYFTVTVEPTKTSIDGSFNILVRSFSGITVKSVIACSDLKETRVPVLTTGLEPGDKVAVGFKLLDESKSHNRFGRLFKVAVV